MPPKPVFFFRLPLGGDRLPVVVLQKNRATLGHDQSTTESSGGNSPWTLVKEVQGYSPPLRFLVNKQTSVCPIEFIRRENFAPTHIRHSNRGLWFSLDFHVSRIASIEEIERTAGAEIHAKLPLIVCFWKIESEKKLYYLFPPFFFTSPAKRGFSASPPPYHLVLPLNARVENEM